MPGKFRLLLPVVLAVLLALASTQNVFAMVIDQKQESFVGATQILSGDPLGQEFQPSLNTLEAVEVNLDTMNQGGDDTITLTIRQGSVTGAVLATAAKSLTQGFSGWVYFALASVRVTVGSTYVIRLSATKNTFGWRYSDGNPYPSGMMIRGELGVPEMVPRQDCAFRTYGSTSSSVGGVIVSTSTYMALAPYLAMIGLVATTAAVAFKKRRD